MREGRREFEFSSWPRPILHFMSEKAKVMLQAFKKDFL